VPFRRAIAARFANWLDNGQPKGIEGVGTTETGAYTLNGAMDIVALTTVPRNAGATWVIPTENEWYKAAYYDPLAGKYWTYAAGTDTTPTSAPPGNTPNTANFHGDTTGFAVGCSFTQNCLTDVGAYTASPSPYGTFDQSGNVFQWNETPRFNISIHQRFARGARGGAFDENSSYLSAGAREFLEPWDEDYYLGFRVAFVPEPCTLVFAILACCAIRLWKKRLM
jgi:formylglycine-generating enzyme